MSELTLKKEPAPEIRSETAFKKKERQKKARSITVLTVIYILLIAIAVIMVLPFLWGVLTSVKTTDEIVKAETFFPRTLSWEHYKRLFNDRRWPWGTFFANSTIITLCIVFFNLFFGSMAAYAFSKQFFRGKQFLIKVFYMSMMVPSIILIIPQFLVTMRFPLFGGNDIFGEGGIGLLDSPLAVIVPGCVGVYSMLFLRQFLMSTPNDIAEAASIDGAGEFRKYLMYVHMIFPGLATLGLFSFNGSWNSYLWPSLVLDKGWWTLPVALKNYNVIDTLNFGPLMAASIFITIPVFCIFLLAQKFFINNITFSGLKL